MGGVTVWRTDSPTSERVCEAVRDGLVSVGAGVKFLHVSQYDGKPTPSVAYGILRGTGRVFRDCAHASVDWWNVDRGFFRPGHFDGYYRIGHGHLQPLFRAGVEVDPDRWSGLKCDVLPWKRNLDGPVVLCPPSEFMCAFYGVVESSWIEKMRARIPECFRRRIALRRKNDTGHTFNILDLARVVVTWNSNVAIDALIRGVPAIAETGLVRSWNGLRPEDLREDLETQDREKLFRFAAACQFTLDEIRSGYAWSETRRILG